jgi:hypothetical protein
MGYFFLFVIPFAFSAAVDDGSGGSKGGGLHAPLVAPVSLSESAAAREMEDAGPSMRRLAGRCAEGDW